MNDNQIISILAVATAVVIVITLFMINPNTPNLPVIYIVYGSEKGDLSYTDCAYLGLFTAQESMPFIKQEFTSIDPDRFSGFLNGSGELKKPGFVITVGFQYAGDTLHFSQEHPETRFLAVDEAGIGSNNTKAYEVSSYGESYLAGVLAASATKTKRVGIILGMPSRPLEGFRLGYEAGVRAADPSVVLEEEYIGNTVSSFSDPKKGVEIADAMYRNGTDIIFTVAGYSGTGVIKAAKADSGRYVIGVDSDQTTLNGGGRLRGAGRGSPWSCCSR